MLVNIYREINPQLFHIGKDGHIKLSDFVKHEINPSYPKNTGIRWSFVEQIATYRIPPVNYHHIVINCKDKSINVISDEKTIPTIIAPAVSLIEMCTINESASSQRVTQEESSKEIKLSQKVNDNVRKKELNWAGRVGCKRSSWIHPDTKNHQ